jgi:hypothetical protein
VEVQGRRLRCAENCRLPENRRENPKSGWSRSGEAAHAAPGQAREVHRGFVFGELAMRPAQCRHAALATLASLALGLVWPGAASGALSFYSDRATWQAASGPATWVESFAGFASDTSFATASVALAGMTIGREGPEAGLTNFIDVPPLAFAGGSSTSQAELFTNFDEGDLIGTQVRIAFAQQNRAFGFSAWAAADFEDAVLEVFDGATLRGTSPVPAGDGAFLGYVLTGGDAATSVRFRSATLIVGTTGEGFAIDDLAVVAVPEPATWITLGLGLAALLLAARRRGR